MLQTLGAGHLSADRRLAIGGLTSFEHDVHLHRATSDSVTLGISNNVSGHGANDALLLGIDENADCFLLNQEEANIRMSTLDNEGIIINWQYRHHLQ